MLSTTTQYALRALLVLAEAPAENLVLGKDIATKAAIPANYLSKLLLTLAGAGLVEATRGSNGGYRLRRAPEDIYLAELVQLFDRQFAPAACFLGVRESCSDLTPCTAHASWKSAKAAFNQFLQTTSLAHISASPIKPAAVGRRRTAR